MTRSWLRSLRAQLPSNRKAPKSRSKPRLFRPGCELLEDRALPAGTTPTATLTGTLLKVEGTDQADALTIQQTSSNISIVANGATLKSFKASQVSKIDVQGWGGDDVITLTGLTKPVTVTGGDGTDVLAASGNVHFTLTNTTLKTGTTTQVTHTFSSVEGVRLTGGSSANKLDASGYSGPVTLDGGAGIDTLLGGTGDDVLTGGAGNDSLSGGRFRIPRETA